MSGAVVVGATKSIAQALSVASCTLLSLSPENVNAIEILPVEISASGMVYVEENHVIVNEDVIQIKKELNDENLITAKIIFDVMSGPSPSGAPVSNTVQTMTSPSGNQTTVQPGEEPTYAFRDSRYAVLVDWEKQTSRLTKWINSASFSAEFDYYSTGISTTYSREINNRLTTITSGLGMAYDYIVPVGGTPEGLVSNNIDSNDGDKTKYDVEWIVGVTQILNRHSLLQLNYTIGNASGYLSDPYKIIAVTDDVTGDPYNLHSYYADKRPDNRVSNIFFVNYLHDISGDVINLSYRYFTDSWKVRSHTYDVKYNFQLKSEKELQLHFRYYDQSAASFYHYSFVEGTESDVAKANDIIDGAARNAQRIDGIVDYASADRRLANIKTVTVGVRYSWQSDFKNAKFGARLDHFRQTDKDGRLFELRGWIAQLVGRFLF